MITTPSGSYAGYTLTSDPLNLGVLELDCDSAAERVLVMSRGGVVITQRPAKAMLSVVVPFSYTLTNDLVVILFDDNNTHNAELVDRVQAQSVDLKTYTAL